MISKKSILVCLLLLPAVLLTACTGQPAASPTPTGPRTLTVLAHDSFAVSEPVVLAFEQQHNLKVQFIKGGDAGSTLNKAILSKDNPLADVLYGVDNTFLSRALQEGIFEPYASPQLAQIPAEFQLDPQNHLLPVDYGDVCPNLDLAYFEERSLPLPKSLDDLLKPEYKSLLVVENPAVSSPGLAFLLATIASYGDPGYLDYWRALVANDVLVANSWDAAYYTEFSLHGGTRPVVVSYGSSPPAEVIFAEQPLDAAPTAVLTGGPACFRQVEFVGVLKGAKNRDLAELWIDYMLSVPFQEDMPLQMFVYPVLPQALLPDEFQRYANRPEATAQLSPETIAANRERWQQAWTETVLR